MAERLPFYQLILGGSKPNPITRRQEMENAKDELKESVDLAEQLKKVQDLVKGPTTAEQLKEAETTLESARKIAEMTSPKSQSIGEQMSDLQKAIEAAKGIASATGPPPPTETKRKYSVVNGTIIPDPEGDLDLKDALLVAAQDKEKGKSTYYYQDPQTGEFKAAEGPIVLHQPSAPQIWHVTAEGNVEKAEPGQPIVVKPSANVAPPQKIWVIRPDATVEESEPGKPIVIAPAQPQRSPELFSILGPDGKPMKLTETGLNAQLKVMEFNEKREQDKAKHEAGIGFLGAIKGDIPEFLKALSAYLRAQAGQPQTGQPVQAGQPTGQPQAGQPSGQPQMFQVDCPECHHRHYFPFGTKNFKCENCGNETKIGPQVAEG